MTCQCEGCGAPVEEPTVTCSICGETVPESETSSTLACRACHKTLTLEECRAGVIR